MLWPRGLGDGSSNNGWLPAGTVESGVGGIQHCCLQLYEVFCGDFAPSRARVSTGSWPSLRTRLDGVDGLGRMTVYLIIQSRRICYWKVEVDKRLHLFKAIDFQLYWITCFHAICFTCDELHHATLHLTASLATARGLCKEKKIPKIRNYYGSGWVGPDLTRIFLCVENLLKIALNQYWYFGVVYQVYCVWILSYTLLNVVGYYDFSVLSMSVMGFQKRKSLDGVGGWGELYPIFFGIFGKKINFAKLLRQYQLHTKGPATRNDFVNDIVDDARADAIFATVKTIVDDGSSTISSTISLRVAGPLNSYTGYLLNIAANSNYPL